MLFVQGTTRNKILFYPRFDHIVLLSAPPEILTARLAARTANLYGKDPAELAEKQKFACRCPLLGSQVERRSPVNFGDDGAAAWNDVGRITRVSG